MHSIFGSWSSLYKVKLNSKLWEQKQWRRYSLSPTSWKFTPVIPNCIFYEVMGEVHFFLYCAWNLGGCVGHRYIMKHEFTSSQCSFIAYLCLWLQCASEARDMLVYCLDWLHCLSPVLSLIWQSPSEPNETCFEPEGAWGACLNLKTPHQTLAEEHAELGGLPELTGSKIQGKYCRCKMSQKRDTKQPNMLIRKTEGWQDSGSKFSFIDIHLTFLRNPQGDVGSDY